MNEFHSVPSKDREYIDCVRAFNSQHLDSTYLSKDRSNYSLIMTNVSKLSRIFLNISCNRTIIFIEDKGENRLTKMFFSILDKKKEMESVHTEEFIN